jgi:hypothetical protein
LEGGLIIGIKRVVFDGVFYDYGCAASGCSVGVVGVMDCVIGNTEVIFHSEVGFRDEHDINIIGVKENLELISVLGEAIGVPYGKLQEFGH